MFHSNPPRGQRLRGSIAALKAGHKIKVWTEVTSQCSARGTRAVTRTKGTTRKIQKGTIHLMTGWKGAGQHPPGGTKPIGPLADPKIGHCGKGQLVGDNPDLTSLKAGFDHIEPSYWTRRGRLRRSQDGLSAYPALGPFLWAHPQFKIVHCCRNHFRASEARGYYHGRIPTRP
jgi:hypothetical protein